MPAAAWLPAGGGRIDVIERQSKSSTPPVPVLRVTRYEQVSSGLFTIIGALGALVFLLSASWGASHKPPPSPAVPVELIELAGGSDEGSVEETLRVESPAPESPDATIAEVAADESEIQEALDTVLELADEVAAQTERQFEVGTRNVGKQGSASGTGRRALGSGKGNAGIPREQRWYVRFGDQQSLDEYARQLDFFGIEFGAIVGGKMVYLSRMSEPRPAVRTVASGAGESRLYMTWQGGGRKQADLQLFRKAGVDVGSGVIFQFYPKAIEDNLARLEFEYRKRRAEEIRRTYFAVTSSGAGYEFSVVRQSYLKGS